MDRRVPKRVILTRSAQDIEKDRGIFESLGFEVVPLPMIETIPLEFKLPEDSVDYVIFPSVKAVRYFFGRADLPEGAKLVAVGEKTRRELESLGHEVWFVPKDMSARGLVEEFPKGRGEIVLIPRSEQGREELLEGLSQKGYRVIPLNLYRTREIMYDRSAIEKSLSSGGFLVFASPSAVRGFFANLPEASERLSSNNVVVVAIGKTTKSELEKFGVLPNIIPPKPLMEEVAGKIHEFWQENCLL